MTEKKLYTCDICHTDYADKDRAKECEKITNYWKKQRLSENTNLLSLLLTGFQLRFVSSSQIVMSGLITSDNKFYQ